MKVIVDTNIIIDVLGKNEKFYDDSYKIILLGLEGEIETIMSASAVTDVYYILMKYIHDAVTVREKIFLLANNVKICKATSEDITNAVILFMPDFEDAVIAAIAKREKADFIITRNDSDFSNSPVPAISPAQFVNRFYNN
ncbi:MAG: PIN domain-containing protein [Treponema sp.]|nr:PIN domain-containing protein [Treponema sp.]